ncbi:MAG: hypothetical protein IIY01_06550 [Clostridia bacterium]|nr:hypothetical protein [Clostridia bacterium]
MKRLICMLVLLCLSLLTLAGCQRPSDPYQEAMALLEQGKIEEAYELLLSIGDREDAKKELAHFYTVPVKSNSTYTAPSVELTQEYSYTYNEKNLPVQILTNGTLSGTQSTTYTYDEKGNLIKEVDVYVNQSSQINEYVYDAEGRILKKIRIDTNSQQYTDEYTYDSTGKLIALLQTNPSGKATAHTYTYDADGNRVGETVVHPDRFRSFYTYAADGELILRVKVSGDGQEWARYELTYDENGRLLRKVDRMQGSYEKAEDYSYDENGNLVQMLQNDGCTTQTYTYTYDERGNRLTETHVAPGGVVRSVIEHTYDTNDRLIQTKKGDTVTTYAYDEEGHLMRKEEVLPSGKKNVFAYTYNERGRLIESLITRVLSSGKENNYRYVYDAYGNPVHSVRPNPDGSTLEVTSEYKLVYIPFPLSEQILELGLIQPIPSAE